MLNHRMTILHLVLLVLLAGPACRAEGPVRRVLLIGNSLTANGNLGGQVREIARAAGEKIELEQSLMGNSGMREHNASAQTQAALASKPWDVVVVWEHGLVLASERLRREVMLPAGRVMAGRIREKKARPILVLVWARKHGCNESFNGAHVEQKDYESMQETERLACEAFSKALGVDVAPAGLAWKAFREKYPEVELYTDIMHANEAGAYLAALTIYATIFQRTPRPVAWHPAQISDDLAIKLHDVATETWERYTAEKQKTKSNASR